MLLVAFVFEGAVGSIDSINGINMIVSFVPLAVHFFICFFVFLFIVDVVGGVFE